MRISSGVRLAGARVVAARAKGGEEGGKDFGSTVFGILAKHGDCVLMTTAITRTNLEETLKDEEKEYTIFCPDDDAMSSFAKKNGCTKLNLYDMEGLPDIVKGHVVEGKFPMADLPEEVTTLAGTTIKTPKVVMNKGRSKKQLANFNSLNGCFHIIDTVLE